MTLYKKEFQLKTLKIILNHLTLMGAKGSSESG